MTQCYFCKRHFSEMVMITKRDDKGKMRWVCPVCYMNTKE